MRLITNVCMEAAASIAYLHTLGILHRDIKPANYLVDANYTVKLIDFGVSKVADPDGLKSTTTGTPIWMAPVFNNIKANQQEVLNQVPYDNKVDVYSYSLVVWAIMMCRHPYGDKDTLYLINDVAMNGEREEINDEWPEEIRSIITTGWDPDPEVRPTMQEIVDRLSDFRDPDRDYAYVSFHEVLDNDLLTRVFGYIKNTRDLRATALTCQRWYDVLKRRLPALERKDTLLDGTGSVSENTQ